MADIDRYRPEDRRAVEALYRRVFGNDAAEASRLRWDWQYHHNPNNPGQEPEIWIAREGRAIVGQYATMPVQLLVRNQEVQGSWGMDVMVAPERQRQGLGEVLFRTWDRNVGASLGLGLSDSSYRLFQKLRWPDVGPVPCLVKPLTRRALRRPTWPVPINRLVSALTLPIIKIVSRTRPLRAEVRLIQRFDDRFTSLWNELAPKFDLAVRRDAPYLNWKYVSSPHVRYSIAALRRDDRNIGYAVYRHLHEPRGRVTLLVDFLADPDDEGALSTLLHWVDREARQANSDKIRTFALHAGFRRILRRTGYFVVKSTMEFVVKVNAVDVDPAFYEDPDRWHVTLGDSDQDR
ncbi:MAG: GNAT family N-acetyltransferase [Acidobacteria bacterium]|nr:GNAT family N-acetyltransferase [Acidobacteriota bacterium]MCA1648736.1 GNAT family N-acetyltransferase [Acidobacteriota bacterium]